jgi:hypothetical protein
MVAAANELHNNRDSPMLALSGLSFRNHSWTPAAYRPSKSWEASRINFSPLLAGIGRRVRPPPAEVRVRLRSIGVVCSLSAMPAMSRVTDLRAHGDGLFRARTKSRLFVLVQSRRQQRFDHPPFGKFATHPANREKVAVGSDDF